MLRCEEKNRGDLELACSGGIGIHSNIVQMPIFRRKSLGFKLLQVQHGKGRGEDNMSHGLDAIYATKPAYSRFGPEMGRKNWRRKTYLTHQSEFPKDSVVEIHDGRKKKTHLLKARNENSHFMIAIRFFKFYL